MPNSGGECPVLVHGCLHGRGVRVKDYSAWAESCREAGFRGEIQGYYWDSIDPLRIVRFLAEVISGTIGERDRIVPGTGRESLFVRKKFLETAKGLALKAGPAIFRGAVNETGRWWEEANVLARAAEAVEGKIFNLDLTENVRRHGEFERILAGLEYFPPG